jgi:hypothetical protein
MLTEMQRAWISNTTALVALFDAAQGHTAGERSSLDRRTGSFRQGWPDILTKLTAREAAMLQDLTWWGPQMKQRLVQLAHVHTTN